jgi:carbon monoxide dehydrogenase subunit G
MSSYKSDKVLIKKNSEDLFNTLIEFENLKNFLPPNIEKFEVKGETCVIKVANLPEIKLTIHEKISNKFVSYSASESPLPFLMKSFIEEIDNDSSYLIFEIDIELNLMTKMMLEKPIKSFINQISNAASKLS